MSQLQCGPNCPFCRWNRWWTKPVCASRRTIFWAWLCAQVIIAIGEIMWEAR